MTRRNLIEYRALRVFIRVELAPDVKPDESGVVIKLSIFPDLARISRRNTFARLGDSRGPTLSLLRYIKPHNQVPERDTDTECSRRNTHRNRNPEHPSNRNSRRFVARRLVRSTRFQRARGSRETVAESKIPSVASIKQIRAADREIASAQAVVALTRASLSDQKHTHVTLLCPPVPFAL